MTRIACLILTGVATLFPPDAQHTYVTGVGVATLTIPQGTDIPVTLDVRVMVKPDQVGNTFPAHITRDLVVEGAVGIPAGAPAEVALLESENGPNAASFRLTRVSIGGRMRPVWTDAARADATASGPNLGQKAGI